MNLKFEGNLVYVFMCNYNTLKKSYFVKVGVHPNKSIHIIYIFFIIFQM